MTHTTNNDKSHKMKIATAILTTIAILCACNSHKPQSTNAEAIPVGDIPEDSTIYNPGVLIINYTRTDSVRAALFAQVKQLNAAVIYDYDIIDAISPPARAAHTIGHQPSHPHPQIPPRHPQRRPRPHRPARHRQITQPKYWSNKPYTPFAILLIPNQL